MVQKSKYVALKKYVPMGLPSEDDFVINEQEIDLSNNNLSLIHI